MRQVVTPTHGHDRSYALDATNPLASIAGVVYRAPLPSLRVTLTPSSGAPVGSCARPEIIPVPYRLSGHSLRRESALHLEGRVREHALAQSTTRVVSGETPPHRTGNSSTVRRVSRLN